jgi:nuclear transport factor 2 (NTF2) superfamily protein
MDQRPPLPPFTFDTAVEKVRKAENAWNTEQSQNCSDQRYAQVRMGSKTPITHGSVNAKKSVWPQGEWIRDVGFMLDPPALAGALRIKSAAASTTRAH